MFNRRYLDNIEKVEILKETKHYVDIKTYWGYETRWRKKEVLLFDSLNDTKTHLISYHNERIEFHKKEVSKIKYLK
jgi:hypothetical protein